jgi:HlyD family secretion protein
MSQKKNNVSRWLIGIGVVAVVGVAGALLLPRVLQTQTAAGQTIPTAEVSAITAISRVESSGTVQALQQASLTWKTTGQVARVNVKVGDRVKAGDVLMELDTVSAPANVIGAQADLINAQNTLDTLLTPKQTDIANAQKAVTDAQEVLEKAERTLRNTQSPDVAYYEDQYNRALQNVTTAEQNSEITNFATSLNNAKDTLDTATSNLNYYKDLEAKYPGYSQQHGNILDKMQDAYDTAVTNYKTAQYNLEQAQARNGNTLTDARDALDTARANLDSAKAGPDSTDLSKAEADVAVAKAKLADAQEKLDELLNGADPEEVAAARARVESAQATVDQLVIKAPFDGEVLAVNYLPGDLVSQTTPAIVLANRSQLHVDVLVDETEVGRIQTGDSVTLTLDSLAGITLNGLVDNINPVGQTVAGLVKYTVRVAATPPAATTIFLGGTANATIVTDVQADVLAVPLDAVQNDAQGEYVNRVNADGAVSRINIRSGELEGDLVTVSGGGLQKGDVVEVPTARPTDGFNAPLIGRGQDR